MIESGNFKVELLAHSINPVGDEAITFATCHERAVHADYMTHRWSRNASSSRAIPFDRMLAWTERDPALPLHLGRNRPGMQSGAEVDDQAGCREGILGLFDHVAEFCRKVLHGKHDLHKEAINRYLEPWGWINTVGTMGRPQLMNAFGLRCSPHADPRAQRLFVGMARLYRASTPRPLEAGEWHLPYVTDRQLRAYDEGLGQAIKWGGAEPDELPERLLVWSAARCAWVSYRTVDGKVATWEKAKRRHDECVESKHCTPLEHQLRARADHGRNGGCVAGYDCYRHMIPDESASDFDFSILDTVYQDRDYIIP